MIVILAVLLAGEASKRVGQPAVLGQLLVGVILGPALLGWLEPTPLIKEMSEIGVLLLMFLAGLETNFDDIRRSAMAATLVAVGGVVLPLVAGWGVAAAWGYETSTAIFMGVLLVATSVSISAQTLRELGQLHTKPGVTVLAAAVIDDVLGIIVLSVALGALGGTAGAGGGHGGDPVGLLLIKIVAFFAVGGLVGWKVLPPIVRWVSRLQSSVALLSVAFAIVLGFAVAAETAGMAGIIGSYLAGLMLSLTEFRERLTHEMEQTAFSFFVPFFFVSVGLTAKFTGLSGGFLGFVAILVLVAVVTKIIGGGLGALLGGFNRHEALGVGVGMVARGEVGLIIAAIGMERGLLTADLYTATVIICLLTTLVTPLLLKVVFSKKSAGAEAKAATAD